MDEVAYSLLLVVIFVCAFFLGWKVREILAIQRMNEHFLEAREKMNKLYEKDVVDISIEKENDTLFVYNKHTSEYMAHASSRDNLEKMLAEKYPGKMFNASTDDIEKMNS